MNPSTETLGFRGFVNRAERDVDEDEDVHVGTEANLLGKLKEVVTVLHCVSCSSRLTQT